MRRVVHVALSIALVVALMLVTGCQPKVEVRSGTKTVCSYGHVVSDDTTMVKVPAEDVGKHGVRTVTVVCPEHAKAEALYRLAQQALAAGRYDEASKQLQQVLALDAGFRAAASQLDALNKGEKPAPDGSTPQSQDPTTTPSDAKPGDGDTATPAASLLKWAPDTLSGFTAEKPSIDVFAIARDYVPAGQQKAATLVIVAEEARTSAGAKAALKVQAKDAYTRDRDTIEVGGHKAYFGTDGRRFASLALTDGSVMILLEMSAKSGDSPTALKKELVSVLEQLP